MLTRSKFFRCSFAAMAFLLLSLSLAPEAHAANDAWLKSQLITTYGLNEHLSPFDIDVQVQEGKVTLSGDVETGIEKDLAGQIARSVEGVSAVQNNLSVVGNSDKERQPSAFYRSVTNATLTAKVKSNLLWNQHVGGGDIAVSTENGVVTLEGVVASEAEKDLAVQLTRNTGGVRSVRDRLQVQEGTPAETSMVEKAAQTVSDTYVTGQVKTVLMASKGMEGADVTVSTDHGVVTLSGTVASEEQAEHVQQIVRNVQSVRKVNSRLTVK